MANTIRLKSGSGNNPSASDLVVGEVALRTDGNPKLFTKNDAGNVLEVGLDSLNDKLPLAGGTLTGNLTISNNAPRITFTDGNHNDFAIIVDGNDLNIQDTTAGQNRLNINSSGVVSCNDGLSVTGNINATGDLTVTGGDVIIQGVEAKLHLTDTNNDDDYLVFNNNGTFKVYDATNNADRLTIASNGRATLKNDVGIDGNLDVGNGLDVTGDINCTSDLILDSTNTDYPRIELHSNATGINKYGIINGQAWNPDALLVYDLDGDQSILTIETSGLGIKRGANSISHCLDVGGTAMIRGNTEIRGNILLSGDATTTNQERTIDFTGFDKEGTTDLSDRAYIRHTTNAGGLTGSVLLISSANDANDGIALSTNNHNNNLRLNGNKVFHAGNDGSGSGLDADTIDGFGSGQFLRSDANDTASGAISFTSHNLELSGHWYNRYFDAANRQNYIHLYPSDPTNNAGSGASVTDIRAWTGSTFNVFQIRGGSSTGLKWRGYTIWTAENDGAGSGLDADTLDGMNLSSTATANTVVQRNASGTVTATTFSGSGASLTNIPAGQLTGTLPALDGSNLTGLTVNNANTLDNLDSTQFLRSDTNTLLNGILTVGGSSVSGNEGGEIRLTHAPNASLSGSNVTIDMNGNNFRIFEDGGNTRGYYLQLNSASNYANTKIWHENNDGSGSGLDSDTLDGVQATGFFRQGGSWAGDLASNGFTRENGLNMTGGAEFVVLSKSGQGHVLIDGSYHAYEGGAFYSYQNSNFSSQVGFYADTTTSAKWKGHLKPNADSTHDLGSSSLRWDNLYVDTIQASQSIFLNGATNFDNLKNSGFYSLYNVDASGHTNAPFKYGAMISAGNTENGLGMAMQIAHERTGAGTFIRGMNDTNDQWYSWHEIWTAGVDGSGSGLDADTLDGINSASFVRSDADDTLNGQYTISDGSNEKLVLAGSSNPLIRWQEGTTNRAYIQWNASSNFLGIYNQEDASSIRLKDVLDFSTDGINYYGIWHSGNDGAGSGLDADTVDGLSANDFLRSNANDTFTAGVLTISSNQNKGLQLNRNIASPSNYYDDVQIEVKATSGTAGIGLHRSGNSHVGIYHDTRNVLEFDFNNGDVVLNHNTGTIWGSGNDGSGTGLDADTLDGIQGANYLRSDTSDDFNGTLTIHSSGTNSYGRIRGYNNDNHFIVIRGSVSTGQSGLTITGAHRTTFCEHAENNDTTGWYFLSRQTGNYTEIARITRTGGIHLQGNKVFHQGNDGSGSGLDADTLDGIQGSDYLRSNTSDTFSGDLTVTGNIFVGDQIRIGDDAFIEDFNAANNIRIKGNQNSSAGFLSFGNQTASLGLNGNDTLIWQGNFRVDKGLYIPNTGYALKFGPGTPANDDAHIEFLGGNNDGKLRISTSDDNGTERIEFGDYDTTDRGGSFTEWGHWKRSNFYVNSTAGIQLHALGGGVDCYRATTAGGIIHFFSNVGGTRQLKTYINEQGSLTSSDYRLKTDIAEITNGVALVKNLKPSTFKWKYDSTTTHHGFIAHELQEVLPNCVEGAKDQMKSDNETPHYQFYSDLELVPVLTAALKEDIARIEDLENKINS